MRLLIKTPFFALHLILYNLYVFAFTDNPEAEMQEALFGFTLPSGATFEPSMATVLLALGVAALYVEIFKSTRTHPSTVIDHVLSTVVFVVFLLELVIVKPCGTTVFFLLTLMSLSDVTAGFTVTIAAARRDFGMDPHIHGGH